MKNSYLSGMLSTHTKAHSVRGRPTVKDVEREFRNGSFRELQKHCLETYKDIERYTKQKQTSAKEFQNNSNETQMKSKELKRKTYSGKQANANCLMSRDFTEVVREEKLPNNLNAILESFEMTFNAFTVSRSPRVIPVTMKISFLFIVLFLFTVVIILFNGLSFVQLSLASVFIACMFALAVEHFINLPTKTSANFLKNDCVEYFVNLPTKTLVNSLKNDYDISEKAVHLSVNSKEYLLDQCRSRYAKFHTRVLVEHNPPVVSRDREPSRLPVKVARAMLKSRKIRRRVRKFVEKNVPMSSRMHCFVSKCNYNDQEVKHPKSYHRKFKKRKPARLALRTRKKLLKSRKSLFIFHKRVSNSSYKGNYCQPLLKNSSSQQCSSCSLLHVYRSLNHRINHSKFTLSKDVEKNPGPSTEIDPNKTISAPYCQGNILIFGSNAGRQCVAMSLCALIYNHRNSITSSVDLVNIMNIGNDLYSVLSRLHNQDFLLLTELPDMVNVLETTYQIEYSPAYTGNIHDVSSTVDFLYCMPLGNALQILMGENYHSFLLTIQCNTVAVYCHGDGRFRIFDSHARNNCGFPSPQGSCVLLDVDDFAALLNYFQNLYNSSTASFEVKGLHITDMCMQQDISENLFSAQTTEKNEVIFNTTDNDYQSNNSKIRNLNSNNSNNIRLKKCCVLSFYCICFSIIKACNYWKSDTMDSICDHGNIVYTQKFSFNKHNLTTSDLPVSLQIYDAEINVSYYHKQSKLCRTSETSQLELQKIIDNNTNHNTGFLAWLSTSCVGCIFQHKSKSTDYYLVILNDNGCFDSFEKVNNVPSLIKRIIDVTTKTGQCDALDYNMLFLSCSCQLSDAARQNIIRKHKSNAKKKAYAEKRKLNYANMEPAKRQKNLLRFQSNSHAWYKSMHTTEKQNRLSDMRINSQIWYNSMDATEKQNRLSEMRTNSQTWYNSMDATEKQKRLSANQTWYNSLNPAEKEKRLLDMQSNFRNLYNSKKDKQYDLDHCIKTFQNKIKEGPYYICSVCNRLLYRKTVTVLNRSKYIIQHLFTGKKSFDEKQYICKTCHSKLLKQQIPCQAVHNKLKVDEVPPELSVLEKLEQILIAQRIVFEKILVMPKGQQRKIKGAICNVPVECDQTCNILPRPPERSGIIMLKLKRKLQFRGHVYFQAVRPQMILCALNWLKMYNTLYSNIAVDMKNINSNLISLQQDRANENNENLSYQNETLESEKSLSKNNILGSHEQNCTGNENMSADDIDNDSITDDNEEKDDPLNQFRTPTNETCLQSVIPDYPIIEENDQASGNEIYNIAPGENRHPVSFMTDKLCEELAFPVLFPRGEFGYTAEREIKLSPVKYFNARLLHYSGRFATNPEYLFFAQFITEQKKISDSVNIALKKVHSQPVSANQLRSNVQSLQNLICQEQAYLFLRQIPASPPYWQKFMYEVVAMVKQLGIPTWFMTLSCADLRWHELFQIIARTQGRNMTNEEVDALSYNERCLMLNLNPVVVAKHFQYRVETFFTEVLLSNANPIGKIVYYALRIEFQMRGSPHLHALIWTSDCPILTSDNKEAYIHFIDKHVQAYLPDKQEDPQLHELVKTYQRHSHSKTCRKYKNIRCRFNFGQFFTNRTIVAEPISNDINEDMKMNIIEKRRETLTLVKEKIDDLLNPSKPNYDPTLTESDIFTSIGITEAQYYSALSVSPDSDYELHLKRPIDSCFINNYFVAGIKGFEANVDLQPVFNHYKCITYICSYFTKDETECSQAIMNAAKEAKDTNMNIRDGLKKIGAAFLSSREVSSQECVYRCMPELWLRKIFPAAVFVSTDLPDRRVRIAKSLEELEKLDDESTDVYKSNIIERYTKRPQSILSVDNLCLAEFASYYYKDYRKECQEIVDAQPQVLTDNLIEAHHNSENGQCSLPDQIRLIDTNEIMKRRKVKAVIRYHTPNKRKEPENFFHHLLMLYSPWRNETKLLGSDGTYASKYYEPDIQPVVDHNRSIFEPDPEAVAEALENLRNNQGIIHSYDSLNDQENDDIHYEMQDDPNPDESFNEQLPSHLSSSHSDQHLPSGIAGYTQPTAISDDELRQCIRSLNNRQRYAFDHVLSWSRNKMKNMNSLKPKENKEIFLFITGGAGAGKSHLIKTIYHAVTKTFTHAPLNPELPSVLLMAPTGVAAININGTTINTALGIPKETGETLKPLTDQNRTQMRIFLSQLKLLVIDEISMVGNTTLLHIHQRLKEIFDTPASKLFAGISIIAVGDMYQLPPIKRKPVFENYNNNTHNLCHPWHVFSMIELTEIMRQKDDQPFAKMLNRFRTACQTEEDIKCIQSRSINQGDDNYPSDAIHVFAENSPVNEHNNNKLNQLPGPAFQLRATDQYPKNVSQNDIDRILSKGRSETGGLDYDIFLKVGAKVMLTNNIDIADRLINGQIGTVIKIDINHITQKPTIIYIKFDDDKAGKNMITKSSSVFVRENSAVPVEPILARIKIRPGKPSSPEIQRVQFPITLAYAVTIHKVQGLSLKEVVISFELFKQRSFNHGQIYVALSRSTSINGIHILGNIQGKHVRADPRVHKEYERLRAISSLLPETIAEPDSFLTISLLNIRSLIKHSLDVKHDSIIFNSHMLCFTETQLLPSSNDNDIKYNLFPFTTFRQDHVSDRYSSLAICSKPSLEIKEQHYFPEINALKFLVDSNMAPVSISMLLLYRKHSSNISQYINSIRYILKNHEVDIILGDFNINYLNDNEVQPLSILMESLNYAQTVKTPTFVSSGSLLDHIYVRNDMLRIVSTTVVPVYYSDHDAIKMSFSFK